MYILLQDTNCSTDKAAYVFCRHTVPVTYQWRIDFQNIEHIKAHHAGEDGQREFTYLRDLLNFYRNRDSANFKVLARGKTLQRLFERYPEILL